MSKEIKPQAPTTSEETTKTATPANPGERLGPWRDTRDLLQKALSDWDQSETDTTKSQANTNTDQKLQKERLETLLTQLKQKLNELSES